MIDLHKDLGEAKLEALKGLIRRTFPDERCDVSDGLVKSILCGLPEEAQLAIAGTKFALETVSDIVYHDDPEVVGFYEVSATHHRFAGGGRHKFVASLPMVRIRLPQSRQQDIQSRIGTCFAGDRLTWSVDLIRAKYQAMTPFVIDRVELVTPARYFGAQFGAVKVYLLYTPEDVVEGFLLEAGMATGEAMVQFFAPTRQSVIHRPSWYEPTPFSTPQQWFTGEAGITGRDKLGQVRIQVADSAESTPHLEVFSSFRPQPEPNPVWASKLTAQAALRVAAIADAMGRADAMMKILAPFGRSLAWEKEPTT
jgi:hypothetical protein